MKFILIMTFLVYGNGNPTPAASIAAAEFDTKEACIRAGEAWAKQATNATYRNGDVTRYICAQK